MVICSSEKFPVNDIVFRMHRRSLSTCMYAEIFDESTWYLAASKNKKDFYNLLDVYLDFVFKPTLSELSFLQEGGRLEFSRLADPSSPLKFKGVVFNEVSGMLANPSFRLSVERNKALFPDNTYGVNALGNPEEVKKLRYDEVLEFHKNHYHPSNCRVF